MTEATISYNSAKYPNFKEYLWFEAHEEASLQQHLGRYIVIKGEQVIGDYGTRKHARQETLKKHEAGSFIIHFCVEKDPRRVPRLRGRKLISVDEK